MGIVMKSRHMYISSFELPPEEFDMETFLKVVEKYLELSKEGTPFIEHIYAHIVRHVELSTYNAIRSKIKNEWPQIEEKDLCDIADKIAGEAVDSVMGGLEDEVEKILEYKNFCYRSVNTYNIGETGFINTPQLDPLEGLEGVCLL